MKGCKGGLSYETAMNLPIPEIENIADSLNRINKAQEKANEREYRRLSNGR